MHNYYFQTVENLENVIMKAIETLNRQTNHTLRLHLKTIQGLLKVAQCRLQKGNDSRAAPSPLTLSGPNRIAGQVPHTNARCGGGSNARGTPDRGDS